MEENKETMSQEEMLNEIFEVENKSAEELNKILEEKAERLENIKDDEYYDLTFKGSDLKEFLNLLDYLQKTRVDLYGIYKTTELVALHNAINTNTILTTIFKKV